jgi:hypothetical protein
MMIGTISLRPRMAASALTLIMALFGVAMAQTAPETSSAPSAGAPSQTLPADSLIPFGFVFGRTTTDEALATWAAANVLVTGRGHAGVGAGSGVDGQSTLPVDRILLVDVREVPFFGSRPARFAFLDDRLYSIQTILSRTILPNHRGDNSQNLSPEALKALQADLRKRFGAPTQTGRDLMAGKEPDIMEWKPGPRTLVLTTGALPGATLTLFDPVLAKKAKQARDEVCNQNVACAGIGRNRH